MAVEIEFVDEIPAKVAGAGRKANPIYAEIAEALQGNPGVNARVFPGVPSGAGAAHRVKQLAKLGLVATSRAVGDKTFDVYARYDGEPIAKAPAKPRAARKPAMKPAAAPRARKPRAKATAASVSE